MNTDNTDVTDLQNWIDFVVEVNKADWLKVLQGIYEELKDDYLAHHRFKKKGDRFGLAVRFIADENSEIVKKVIKCVTDLGLVYSVNPKQTDDTEMAELSGWFNKLDKNEWKILKKQWKLEMTDQIIEKLVTLWHEMSQLTLKAIDIGLVSSQSRRQFSHQLVNMIATWEKSVVSLFF